MFFRVNVPETSASGGLAFGASHAALRGEQCGLRTVFELELGEDDADVAFDRAFGETEVGGDLAIALAVRDQLQHAAFAVSEGGERIGGFADAQLFDERTLRLRMQPRLAR